MKKIYSLCLGALWGMACFLIFLPESAALSVEEELVETIQQVSVASKSSSGSQTAERPQEYKWTSRGDVVDLTISSISLVDLKLPDEYIPRYGFYPIQVDVRNLRSVPRVLTFSRPGSDMTIDVRVPPDTAIRRILYFPMRGDHSGSYVSGYISATEQGRGVVANGPHCSSRYGANLAVGGEASFFRRDVLAGVKARHFSFSPLFFHDYPADWKVYSSLDVILLENNTFNQLDKARKNVLLEWVFDGGNLILNNHGDKSANGVNTGVYGRGEISRVEVNTNDNTALEKFFDQLGSSEQSRSMDYADNKLDPRPDDYSMRLPAITAFFIILFVILVGPVNLWVLAPAGKRQRLFLTTPVITFAAGFIMFLIILGIDGFGGSGKRLTYIELYPEGNSAYIHQSQVSRSGVLSATNFSLAADTLFHDRVLSSNQRSWATKQGQRTEDAGFSYFSSRSARWQSLSRREMTRGTVTHIETDEKGNLIMLSSLSVTLKEFFYCDANNQYWRAPELKPGMKTVLEKVKPEKSSIILFGTGSFQAKGEPGELGPIPTLPSMKWDDTVIYRGYIVERK